VLCSKVKPFPFLQVKELAYAIVKNNPANWNEAAIKLLMDKQKVADDWYHKMLSINFEETTCVTSWL